MERNSSLLKVSTYNFHALLFFLIKLAQLAGILQMLDIFDYCSLTVPAVSRRRRFFACGGRVVQERPPRYWRGGGPESEGRDKKKEIGKKTQHSLKLPKQVVV